MTKAEAKQTRFKYGLRACYTGLIGFFLLCVGGLQAVYSCLASTGDRNLGFLANACAYAYNSIPVISLLWPLSLDAGSKSEVNIYALVVALIGFLIILVCFKSVYLAKYWGERIAKAKERNDEVGMYDP